MKIIAFYATESRSGKDTCANILTELFDEMGFSYKTVAFADKLKQCCHELFQSYGVKDKQFYELNPDERKTIIPDLNMDVVNLWIKYGNHMRDINPDIWVKLALDNPELNSLYDFILIPDMRFNNELNYIKKFNHIIFKIQRDSKYTIKRDSDDKITESFNSILIENNGSLEDLKCNIIKHLNFVIS